MVKKPAQKHSLRLNASKRSVFFAQLSETANVTASARAAGTSSSAVYAERRRSGQFRDAWSEALSEGYAKLEADLLAEALQPASGKTADATLRARAQKQRLGTTLLSAHRGSAKSYANSRQANGTVDLGVLKAQLILKLTQMRERAGVSLEGANKIDGERST